ncbi:CRE-INS-23 protein [Caenorhabditis remanei]|uniref:CRE-INS-23 protein n=1 Tax=Caenorhabditis remanei TaxID=31234 RepID=E3LS16_CAERE|nr:CRE-INS-23 protein [Caenorhabditis remanei]
MNTFFFFVLLFFVFSSSLMAHSDRHVRSLCGVKAAKNILKICPGEKGIPCNNGALPSMTEYCSMGFSDSQIKFMCCPDTLKK